MTGKKVENRRSSEDRRQGNRRDAGRSKKAERKRLAITKKGQTAHLRRSLAEGTFIVFDIETTGGNPERNGITEIMAIKVHHGEAVGTFYSLVNPKRRIPPLVKRMTGITNQMVRDQPEIKDVMPDFLAFAENHVLVSHNTIGDMKFLRHFSEEVCGEMMANYYLCTHLLTEKLLPSVPDKSLKGLAKNLDLVAKGQLHRAEADAYLTWELFKVLLGRLNEERLDTIIDAIRFQGDYESGSRLGWGVPKAQLLDLPRKPGLVYLHDRHQNISFAIGVPDIQQGARELAQTALLPRQLIKVALQATRLSYDTKTSFFAAQMAEAAFVGDHNLVFDPADWHQKVAQFVYLQKDQEGFHLGFGPLVPGTVVAFGPVRNGRLIAEFFEDLGERLGIKAKRRGVTLTSSQAAGVKSVLLGLAEVVPEQIWRKLVAVVLPFSKQKKHQTHSFNALKTIAIPSEIRPIKDGTGVLGIKSGGSWDFYTVVAGVPTLRESLDCNDVPFSPESLAARCQQWQRRLARARTVVFRRPLTPWQVNAANRVFWWLAQRRRQDSLWLALDELP